MPYKARLKSGAEFTSESIRTQRPILWDLIQQIKIFDLEQIDEIWWDCEGGASSCGGSWFLETRSSGCWQHHPLLYNDRELVSKYFKNYPIGSPEDDYKRLKLV